MNQVKIAEYRKCGHSNGVEGVDSNSVHPFVSDALTISLSHTLPRDVKINNAVHRRTL
jgi:hypothetical protein